MSVELSKLRSTHDWTFNPSVMLANALTAFILNLVGGGRFGLRAAGACFQVGGAGLWPRAKSRTAMHQRLACAGSGMLTHTQRVRHVGLCAGSDSWRCCWCRMLHDGGPPVAHGWHTPSPSPPHSFPRKAVFLLIGKTSALTMNIAGVIKDWMLIFFSFYLFKVRGRGALMTHLCLCVPTHPCQGIYLRSHSSSSHLL